jgi:hypothetical protein
MSEPRGVRFRGQSEVLAVVLLFGLTVLGTVTIVAVGSDSLDQTETEAELQRAEHAMTTFDSESVLVALDESEVKRVPLGDSGGGQYSVSEDAGWIRVTHHNHTSSGSTSETIYNRTLGAVTYRNDGRTIAYQGGGVWRSDGEGSVMVSPPEFHYRSETLTLSSIHVRGSGHVSGTAHATVTSERNRTRIFPNETLYQGTTKQYANPVQNGMVEVTVRSEYYQGWATYFRARTQGEVSVDHGNETTVLELTAGGTIGQFKMPKESNAVEIRGLDDPHAVENFTIVLAPDDVDAAKFNNLQWSMYVDNGNREMEYHLRKSGEVVNNSVACDLETVSLTVYYSDTNGDPYEGWHAPDAFTTNCVDRDGDGTKDEAQLVANLTGSVEMTMTDLSNTDLQYFNPSGNTRSSTYVFDEHEASVSWEAETYDASNPNTSARNLTNHYLSMLSGDFDIVIDDKPSDTINEDASWGQIDYDGEGRVTFMHITSNHVRVEITN